MAALPPHPLQDHYSLPAEFPLALVDPLLRHHLEDSRHVCCTTFDGANYSVSFTPDVRDALNEDTYTNIRQSVYNALRHSHVAALSALPDRLDAVLQTEFSTTYLLSTFEGSLSAHIIEEGYPDRTHRTFVARFERPDIHLAWHARTHIGEADFTWEEEISSHIVGYNSCASTFEIVGLQWNTFTANIMQDWAHWLAKSAYMHMCSLIDNAA